MFRLHFTGEDLVRLRFLAQPAPMVELVLGLMTLRNTKADIFDQWRHTTRRAFPRAAMPLFDLVYPDSGPEYLDSLASTLAEGMHEMLDSDPGLVRLPYQDGAAHHPVMPWVRDLAEGDRASQRILTSALHAAYHGMFGEDWRRVETSHQIDLAYRRPIMAGDGIEAALASVLPNAKWIDGALCAESRHETDIRLTGDGVTLVPSAFLTYAVFGRHVPGRPLLIMYPARLPLPMIVDNAGQSLAPLIGSTRAAVLGVVVEKDSVTTSGLGRRLGISPGRASEHASVLRAAGLITSQRDGNVVLHTPTALGRSLLSGNA